MFGRLVQKELLHHLLDFRFIIVFALCALLSALSVYVGGLNYARRLQEYSVVSENSRRAFQEASLDKGRLLDLIWLGYRWNRRPEVLSPVVYGLSGILGREAIVRYQQSPLFETSFFAVDPIHALFEVLDLSFIVKMVLSLAVLLFTYDAICGEKEGGTLRLYASFPVSRSTLATAKLIGSTVAVLIPFAFAFLFASVALALSPGLGLQGEDWMRMGALMVVFAFYLMVFAAFGLWASALTHRRVTAFLGLLVLWAVWIFILPNLALDAAGRLTPAPSFYKLQKQDIGLRVEIGKKRQAESDAYWQRNAVEDWDALPEARRRDLTMGSRKIQNKWDAAFYSRLGNLQTERRNQLRKQQRLTMALSAVSPLGAVSFVSMDLARTGHVQQERIEDALSVHLISLNQFVQDKRRQSLSSFSGVDLTDFSWFTYQDNESFWECLSRNMLHILNLVLLAVLGFVGAYVAILKYDVR